MNSFGDKINILNDMLYRFNNLVAPPATKVSELIKQLQDMMVNVVLYDRLDDVVIRTITNQLQEYERYAEDKWQQWTLDRTIESTKTKSYYKVVNKVLSGKAVTFLDLAKCLTSFATHIMIEEQVTNTPSDAVSHILGAVRDAYSTRDILQLQNLVMGLFQKK